jgi:hypothetical protein
MPDLAILATAYDVAYRTVTPAVRSAPPRIQSDEILCSVARACQAADGSTLGLAERLIITAFAEAAANPAALTRLIAAINAEAGDNDFPAASLDPRGRRGWATSGRIICKPPWNDSTDGLLAELRFAAESLRGEKLHAQLAANIADRTEAFFLVPENPKLDPRAHRMLPLDLAAIYLLCFEVRIRELEDALAESERTHHAEP